MELRGADRLYMNTRAFKAGMTPAEFVGLPCRVW
jgi:hypothetical protein